MPAAALARDLALPRSSIYHLLAVLRDQGFVVHLPEERRYGLGVAAFELGSAYTRQAPLQRVARPVLHRLVDTATYTGHLAVLHGRDVLYVLEDRATRRPPLVTDVGVRLPAQLTASGLAMLADLPAAQVRALFPSRDDFVQRYAGLDSPSVGSPASLPELRRVLVGVRRRGFAVEQGSVTPGLASVAAAATDHNGHPVAGLAITYPDVDVAPAEVESLARLVVLAAADLTRRMGGRRRA